MKYSIVRAKEKELIKSDTKLWLFLMMVIVSIFIVIKIFIVIQIAIVERESEKNRLIRYEYETETSVINNKIAVILNDSKLVSTVHARNRVIKDSLLNIFELVPDQIYLTELSMTSTSLNIKGLTPSKEVFNYLFKPPLESIFESTETSFYPLGNGWLAFRSINKSKEKLIYEKN